MKNLNQKEWVAVIIALFVVGFFFVFGSGLLSIFKSSNGTAISSSGPQLLKQDEVVGAGDEAIAGSRVTVHYIGRFVDGKVFDSSIARGEPLQFILGTGQVIDGWDKGLIGMRVGGKRLLSIPP